MPQPSQWRMTNAVRSASERAARACSICFRSSMLCVKRSGVGASSRTLFKRIVFHSVAVRCSRGFPPRILFLFLAHAVNRIVRGDAIHPRAEIRSRRELAEFLIAAQKCLLDDLFGIVPIAGHAVSQTENIVAVPLDKNAKGIAIARERALDGDGVALSDGLGAIDALLHPIH